MEKINEKAKTTPAGKYAGMSADEVLAQALGTPTPETLPQETQEATAASNVVQLKPLVDKDSVTQINTEFQKIQELRAKERDQDAELKKVADIIEHLQTTTAQSMPIQPLSTKDVSKLININELFTRHEAKTSTFHINGKAITICLNGDYDALVKSVGLATNLVVDSGDNYIFAPNQRIISELVFIREITDLNLEFLIRPEIKLSQLIETYDILMPLIKHIEQIEDAEFQSYRGWYICELNKSIDAVIAYQNSAKGIVDALAAHNIKDQQTMTEQLTALDTEKLSTVIDFMKNMEPDKK